MSNQAPFAFVLQLGLGLLIVPGNIKIARKQYVHKAKGILEFDLSKPLSKEINCADFLRRKRRGLPISFNFGPGVIA
jgi:hypothetical protein